MPITTDMGNGAREAVHDYLARRFAASESESDHFLASLWVAGYKIVPIEEQQCSPKPT